MSTANSNDNSNSSNRDGNLTQPSIANAGSIAQAQRSDGRSRSQSQSQSLPHLQNRGFSFAQHHPQAEIVQSRRSHLQTPDQLRNPCSPSTGPKRTQQKPPSRPSTNAPVPFKSMEIAPAPWRKRMKLSNATIPETVRALVPQSALLPNLLELESRIDSSIARKKSELSETLKHDLTLKRTLRVYVFNTFCQDPDKNNEESPCWTLKVAGRILSGDGDGDGQKESRCPNFSYFFDRITISLDASLYPDDGGVITWERNGSKAEAFPEGFRVRRNGDQEFTAVVELVAHNVPAKFRLSEKLMRVLGIEEDTYRGIMAAFWEYVKIKKLQDPRDPSLLICDPPLKEVIGEDRVRFGSVRKKLMEHHHLSSPPVIRLEHRMNLSGNSASPTCHDMSVDVPLFTDLETVEMGEEVGAFDQRISAASEKLHDHSVRHAFFSGFSESPSEFINALLRSQSRDLNLAHGDAVRDEETESRSDFYREPWVDDAVVRYVARRPCPK